MYDLKTHGYSELEFKGQGSKVAQIQSDTSNKQKQLEKKIENDLLMESYGRCLKDPVSGKLYRFFKPRMPERADDGRYHGQKDKAYHILVKNEDGSAREYPLACGRYYMPMRWWCFDDTLYHVKYQKDANGNDSFYLDILSFYNY